MKVYEIIVSIDQFNVKEKDHKSHELSHYEERREPKK